MGPGTWVSIVAFALLVLAAALGPRRLGRLTRLSLLARWVRHKGPSGIADAMPLGRPIEAIAADVHRLGLTFRYPPERASFTRLEARRQAYDAVLGEACTALDLPHLLHVLPPGSDLDRERDRVEGVLDWSGFSPHLLP